MPTLAERDVDVEAESPKHGREWWGMPPRLLLLDRQLPYCDAKRVERRIISASQAAVYDAALDIDFRDAVRDNRAVQLLVALRSAAERVVGALRRRRIVTTPAVALRLRDMPIQGEWVILGKDWPNEIAFGAIGRFWAGETKWMPTSAGEFATFDGPGFAKVACHIHTRPLAGGQTLLTYEVRTKATDEASRRAFMRYWHVVSPFVGVVMRSLLATIERAVAHR